MTRALLVLALLIPAICAGYYFAVALPANNAARVEIERAQLKLQADQYMDKQAAEKRAEDKAAAEAEAKAHVPLLQPLEPYELDGCLDAADKHRDEYVAMNGGRPIAGKPGWSNAPQGVWDKADSQRKEEIDECYRRFGKR